MVGSLDHDWSEFLVPVPNEGLLAFRLAHVGHAAFPTDVALGLFLVDEVGGNPLVKHLDFFLHDALRILLIKYGLLYKGWLVRIVLGR